jgi:hypothetical protein
MTHRLLENLCLNLWFKKKKRPHSLPWLTPNRFRTNKTKFRVL